MIYCIWYPSGGFGHYVNGIVSVYGKNFVSPHGRVDEFSSNGNSHKLDLVMPKYNDTCADHYQFNADSDKNYSVLIDNGINNESKNFLKTFPDSVVIKLCYSDYTWPVVARTMIEKAMVADFATELGINYYTESWARREKYFLYLRDHSLRHCWKPETGSFPIYIDDLLDYHQFQKRLADAGIIVDNFKMTWDNWYKANNTYFDPIVAAKATLKQVGRREYSLLNSFNDEWSQAVLYYAIWIEYGVEVPHNDFSNFFQDTVEIANWLNL